ncbi:MAG: hypothetical protein HXX19_20810, partial [Rhodoferax sp.]|nr:hypothetical protein [Rhodoferax sp.]
LAPAHLPASAACQSCHINSTPTGLVPSAGMKTFAGAGFIHTGITSGCETCHGPNVVAGSFAGNPSIVVMPQSGVPGASAHIPSSTTCESCHLGSMPASLIPFSASAPAIGSTGFRTSPPTSAKIHANSNTSSCAACHEGGMAWVGVDLYPRASSVYVPHAIYTGYQTRPGTGGSYAVNDASHPGAGLDCGTCHTSFSGFGPLSLPSGHIPVASTATCGNCHSNFSTPPTIDAIHAYAPSQTSNCAQCHSTDNAALYTVTRAIVTPPIDHIPMGTLSCESCHVGALSSIKATPVKTGDSFAASLFNHAGTTVACSYCHGVNVDASTFKGLSGIKVLSYTATPPHMKVNSQLGCESCHLGSVPTGQVGVGVGSKSFAGASFIHSNITSDCENCHGPSITPASFMGSPKIVVMPPSVVAGPGSHIPSSTTCESCHLSSMPSGLLPGSASKTTGPGTGFQSPAPSSSQVHGNSNTASCNLCHEKNQSWIGMSMYPGAPAGARVPGATYTGFQTRPFAGGTGTSVNDATHVTSGECSDCHNGFTGFAPPTMGSNHIPV